MRLDNAWYPKCQLDLHQGWIIRLPGCFGALPFLESQGFHRVDLELFQREVLSALIGVQQNLELHIVRS